MTLGLAPVLFCVFAISMTFLAKELQHALGQLVRLRQHRLRGLVENVVLGVGHHFLGDVGVADGGLGVLDVLAHDAEVVDGVLEAVLAGAQRTADVGDHVDGVLDEIGRAHV